MEKTKYKKRKDFARELGVCEDTVSKWVKAGKHGLRAVMIGNLMYIDTSKFEPQEVKVEASK
ncbi:MAG: hypothetical protein JSS83_17490 [Cyanobacteria bacterium SZAS LIN-3]|nr:hypothetical protein [Cyanobacteria bacterium SZAS LIN-3]